MGVPNNSDPHIDIRVPMEREGRGRRAEGQRDNDAVVGAGSRPRDDRPDGEPYRVPPETGRPDAEVKDSHNTVQSVTQVNQLSNTVLLFALAVFVLSIAMAAYAIGVANQAERQAQNAE